MAENGTGKKNRIRVLVVDDSAVVRRVMEAVLTTDPAIEVSSAADPLIALSKIERSRPDVVITDLEMPRMDGLVFLQKLMASDDPLPVIVCSGLAESGSERAISALMLGATDVIPRPRLGARDFLQESAALLLDAVRAAASAKPKSRTILPVSKANSADVILPPLANPKPLRESARIVAIGASTGGTEAIENFLRRMPSACPGIVIVQHMPEGFTAAFAERLNRVCAMHVKEAQSGERVVPGKAFIAPGNRHLIVRPSGGSYLTELQDGPAVGRHRPSVDVLFRSVARAAGHNAIGVLLTGMGADGAQGLLEMRNTGAGTIAQDEASCVVFGMPREAIALGAAGSVLPLHEIPEAVLDLCESDAWTRSGEHQQADSRKPECRK